MKIKVGELASCARENVGNPRNGEISPNILSTTFREKDFFSVTFRYFDEFAILPGRKEGRGERNKDG